MGTKRPFDEDLQEFIKHPRHIDNGNKPDYFGEDKHSYETSQNGEIAGEGGANFFHTGEIRDKVVAEPDMVDKAFETSDSLPLVTAISGREEACGLGAAFFPNIFPEFFEVNMPRRQLIHYDDTYSSLLNISPRKEVPVGPEYQADVPELDSESAKSYISDNGGEHSFMGICVISDIEGEAITAQAECKCLDSGSIRCVQQHVSEARLNLKEYLGHEKFVELGFNNMGEEVSGNWSEEEEQLFQDVVYSNPVSHGKRFWEQLSIAFPSRTKKEIVSYYFNVFILRRRAVQNRSHLLAIDSDDDEWWGRKLESSGATIEDEDFHVVEPYADHQGLDFSSEAGGEIGGAEGDDQRKINESSSTIIHDEKVTSENAPEKPLNLNKQEANNSGVRSESYLHWDPPYSTMGPTKGVDLLPTCSMIEEIFGSSKTSKGN